jgi:hypothetical protein
MWRRGFAWGAAAVLRPWSLEASGAVLFVTLALPLGGWNLTDRLGVAAS